LPRKVGAPLDANATHMAALREGTAAAGGEMVLFASHARLMKNLASAAVGLPCVGGAQELAAVAVDSQRVNHGLPRCLQLMREGMPGLQVVVLLGSRWVHLLGTSALDGCHVLSMPITPANVAGALRHVFAAPKAARPDSAATALAAESPEDGIACIEHLSIDRHRSV
ncbi:unnamed protein product, partial [Phaeothamnion confervicola]